MKLAIVLSIFTLFFFAQASLGETAARKTKLAELKQRLSDLEKQQLELENWYKDFYILENKQVSPFLKEKILIGGYFETGIMNIFGPVTKNQTAADQHVLGLNLTADFSEKLRFVTQALTVINIPILNLNNNPNLTPSQRTFSRLTSSAYILQGYLEYRYNEFFNMQSGLGYAPFGIAFQQREAYLFHARGGPQVISNDDGFNITSASALWMGLHFYGLLPFLETKTIGYNLYTMTPGSNVATLGMGGRLWWTLNEYATVGTSFQSAKKTHGSYFAHGLDINIKYNQFGLLGEYGTVVNTQALDAESYYVEPYYKFFEDHWLVYVSIEYLRTLDRFDVFTQIPDPFEKYVYGTGVNWLPLPNTRFRLGYLKHEYLKETDSQNGQNKNFESIELSLAIAF